MVQSTDTTPDLRERYAEAAAEWALMYPISSWALREGEAAEGLAKIWGEQIARYLTKYVRDEELERLRAELVEAKRQSSAFRNEALGDLSDVVRERSEARAERDALKATVERVREICEGDKTLKDAYDLAADVLIALDA